MELQCHATVKHSAPTATSRVLRTEASVVVRPAQQAGAVMPAMYGTMRSPTKDAPVRTVCKINLPMLLAKCG